MNRMEEYDSYEIEEPSDEERAESSSEDELDVLLNGTQEQKRKLIREYLTGESEPSSEDEFEKEMEAELSSTMKTMECQWGAPADSGAQGMASSASATNTSTPAAAPPQLYDSIYFDSDSDEDERSGNSASCRAKQRRILTNDELLYDPDIDDLDQAWVDAQRKRYRECRAKRSAAGRGAPSQSLPSSDAILNCPACMTTLCLDCQRHEKYRTQYRAMFVMNCTINKEEVLRYKTPNDKQRRNRRKRRAGCQEAAPAGAEPEETYHPVQCAECATEVAVFDKDEVYHFFNILASHC